MGSNLGVFKPVKRLQAKLQFIPSGYLAFKHKLQAFQHNVTKVYLDFIFHRRYMHAFLVAIRVLS